jgi:hypothetical protein
MKSLIATVMLCALAIGAPAADKKKAKPTPQAVTIPQDAVANPDGTYNYTDKQGKKWKYVKTPFGVMKQAAPDADAAGAAASNPAPAPGATKAIDKGDTVRFERSSPFGTMSWEKKKSELTDDERHILDTQTAKTDKND